MFSYWKDLSIAGETTFPVEPAFRGVFLMKLNNFWASCVLLMWYMYHSTRSFFNMEYAKERSSSHQRREGRKPACSVVTQWEANLMSTTLGCPATNYPTTLEDRLLMSRPVPPPPVQVCLSVTHRLAASIFQFKLNAGTDSSQKSLWGILSLPFCRHMHN